MWGSDVRRVVGKRRVWFNPQTEMGWQKTQPAKKRRRLALRAHGGDGLATARALQALANVSQDRMTRTVAASDARYFFALHKRRG